MKLGSEMAEDESVTRWGMGSGAGGSCQCETWWSRDDVVYDKKQDNVGCSRDDWPVEWCATPVGCGYEGSAVDADGEPLWWDDCKPAEKAAPDPYDYVPAFTQVTVTADGVRTAQGRTVTKVLPEWANEKVVSLTIRDEKGISNIRVEHNKAGGLLRTSS